jgi:hypothetical protein
MTEPIINSEKMDEEKIIGHHTCSAEDVKRSFLVFPERYV